MDSLNIVGHAARRDAGNVQPANKKTLRACFTGRIDT
jgi:hypothetical protein